MIVFANVTLLTVLALDVSAAINRGQHLIPETSAQIKGLGDHYSGGSAAVSNARLVGYRPVVAPIHAAMRSTVAVSIPK